MEFWVNDGDGDGDGVVVVLSPYPRKWIVGSIRSFWVNENDL